MIAKRVLAVVSAAALIAGAWFVRTRVIDDDTPSVAGPASRAGQVVCVADLGDVCRSVAASLGISIRVESVEATLAAWGTQRNAPDEVWITMAPFPAMAESLRSSARFDALAPDVQVVATSPLRLITNTRVAEPLTIACGTKVDWSCLGDASTGTSVGFAPFPSSAIGQLGVTSAVVGFGNGSVPSSSDSAFTVWARQIARRSNNGSRVPTAVSQIQTRQSAFDVAVGAAAELVDPVDPRFAMLTPEGAPTIDVVVATPDGVRSPDDLVPTLRDALDLARWTPTGNPGVTPTADAMLAVREIWKDFL